MKNKLANYDSRLTKSASWIIGGSQVKHCAFKLLSQFCRSFDLFTGTCRVRKAHTAHLPKSAFTLAETLIVIGIIGVVAALTLPNLNHATGDKEKVTRVKKALTSLTEANDRATATFGDLSEWPESCRENFDICWMKRAGQFLKASRSCEAAEIDEETGAPVGCESLDKYGAGFRSIIQLPDGAVIGVGGWDSDCTDSYGMFNDVCINGLYVDIDGPNKGKNQQGNDIFQFMISDRNSVMPIRDDDMGGEEEASYCMEEKSAYECTYWVIDNGNMDYLKTDSSGKCNDNPSIVLDGVTNTTCH